MSLNSHIYSPENSTRWRLALFGGSLLVTLTLLLGFSYQWNVQNLDDEALRLALAEAKSNWKKDAAFRQWATLHGGVYVTPDERTPPNPNLDHLPDRDVETTGGKKLTLMNPAYMMRQMTEEFEASFKIKGKITGEIQLNPDNRPDEWQRKALRLFAEGQGELVEQTLIDGEPYLRYMKPMYMTEGCVKCHGILGYKEGDLRGGVSVSIPLLPYMQGSAETRQGILVTHAGIWLAGVLMILLFVTILNQYLKRISHEAMYDSLTGLPNLRLFQNRVDLAVKKFKRDDDYQFAVCFLDLDRFKNLNDSLGHHTGDRLLVALAKRFSDTLRPGDTVARMGGDEFTFLLDDIDNLDSAIIITERILHSMKEPFEIDRNTIHTNASIGVCISDSKYENSGDMIRDADIAMYRAKESGKGRIDIFNASMHDYAMESMRIENDLQSALDKRQLEVYYQPVVHLESNRIRGFEALLRWHHPELGNIPPDRFIPIAEQNGLIREIGLWVLEEACRQTKEWSLQFSPENEFNVSVNLSGVQLAEKDIATAIGHILEKRHFNPSALHLEVTETMLVLQKELAKDATDAIRAMGISLSIDDFGKGYCSLNYLQQFNFDTLKIDKDFVQDMGPGGKGLQLVRTLMLLARDLGMRVIAEGVEEQEQLDRLRAMGCPFIQGYYYSRPLPAIEMKALLLAGHHETASRLTRDSLTG